MYIDHSQFPILRCCHARVQVATHSPSGEATVVGELDLNYSPPFSDNVLILTHNVKKVSGYSEVSGIIISAQAVNVIGIVLDSDAPNRSEELLSDFLDHRVRIERK